MYPPIESNTVGILLKDWRGRVGDMIREQMKLGPVFVRLSAPPQPPTKSNSPHQCTEPSPTSDRSES